MLYTNYKRVMLMITLALALIGNFVLPVHAALAEAGHTAIVIAENLNLRTGPGFDYLVYRLLPLGQKLTVLTEGEKWCQVRLPDGTEGWVFSLYIADNATGAFVITEGANLRLGPGLDYRILKELTQGQAVTITGRNVYSDWLEIRLTDGTGGWIYSPLVYTSADITVLPIKEAYGGPTGSGSYNTVTFPLVVTIRNNQAVVDLHDFPGKKEVVIYLGTADKPADLVVAKGKTDANGSARITFEMPAEWSNQKVIVEQNLILVASLADGSFSKSAKIMYLH